MVAAMSNGLTEAELVAIARREWFRRPDGERRYVEAYPRLDFAKCARAAREGLNACIWRDADGHEVGVAEFAWRSETRLRLHYLFEIAWDPAQATEIDFVVERKDSADFSHRPRARCPSCGQSRTGLVFRHSGWSCRRCHGLGYRSAMIGTPVRRAEKVRRLRSELADLERQFYPARRVAAKQAQLDRAVAGLRGSEQASAHAGLALVIVATWGSLASTDSESGNHDDEGSAF